MIVRGHSPNVVLLSTVLLDIRAADGCRHSLRALLDSGSQASFITQRSVNALMLDYHRTQVNITTFANTTTNPVCGKSTITITPRGKSTPIVCFDALIVPQITVKTPQAPVDPETWEHIKTLSLADPLYHLPGDIDLLLGADILPSILLSGHISGRVGNPLP